MGHLIIPGIVEPLTAPSNFPKPGTPLNDLTWEEVKAISDAGLAADYFSVGDVKTIAINGTVVSTAFSNLAVDAFIIGINHNASLEGANLIHFQIGKIGGHDVSLCDAKVGYAYSSGGTFVMNTSSSNSGGWASCRMRKTILGSDSNPTSPTANTLLAALPADLRAVMKAITKYTDNKGNKSTASSAVTATTDYLPLLAEFEVQGARSYANSYEQNKQKQYDYYKAGNSKVKHRHNSPGTYAEAWSLRSANCSTNSSWTVISYEGYMNADAATGSRGLAPAFAV